MSVGDLINLYRVIPLYTNFNEGRKGMNDYIIKPIVENGEVHFAIYLNGSFVQSENTKSDALHAIRESLSN